MPANVTTVFSNQHNISELIRKTDILIGAVLVVGKKAPNLITNSMLKTMKPRSVIIDVPEEAIAIFFKFDSGLISLVEKIFVGLSSQL